MTQPSGVLLKKPDPPADYLDFWQRAVAEADSSPLDALREHRASDDTVSHSVERLSLQSSDSSLRLYGWYAVPHKAEPPFDGLLWLPGYGLGGQVPVNEITAHPELATLSINLHGLQPDDYREYAPSDGYLTQGIESPDTYVFRRLVIDSIRALNALSEQPEANSGLLFVGGVSQGAGLALHLAAFAPKMQAVIADMPFMTYWEYLLGVPALRYPLKELNDYIGGDEKRRKAVLATLAYFETVNAAPHIQTPVQLSMGARDPSIRTPVVMSLYDALSCPKRMIVYEKHGHEFVPDEMPGYLREWTALTRPSKPR